MSNLRDLINTLRQFERDHPNIQEVSVYGINSNGNPLSSL